MQTNPRLAECIALINTWRHDDAARAVPMLLAILADTPDDDKALHLMASAAITLGGYAQAESFLDMALAHAPPDRIAGLWSHKGVLLSSLCRHDEALEAFDRAMAAGGDRADITFNTLQTLLSCERRQECLDLHAASLGQPWYQPRLATFAAHAAFGLGQNEAAVGLARQALGAPAESTPEDLTRRAHLMQLAAAALARLGRQDEATATLRDAFREGRAKAASDPDSIEQRRKHLAAQPPRPDPAERPTSYHFVTAFWGEEFRRRFLECLAAVHLAPRNAAVLRRIPARFRIFTPTADALALANEPVFQRLRALVKVEIVPMDDIARGQATYARFTACHQQAIRTAEAERAAVLLLFPDAVINDGYLDFVVGQMEAGKRAVMICAARVDQSVFEDRIEHGGARQPDGSLVLDSRRMVAWAAVRHHPISRSLFPDAPEMLGGGPYHLYWHLPDGGWLARAFSMAPLCVFPVVPMRRLGSTFDMHYIDQTVPNVEDIVVVTDSDDVMLVDMSPADMIRDHRRIERTDPVYALLRQLWWVETEASEHLRHLATHDILFHIDDVGPACDPARHQADRMIGTLLAHRPLTLDPTDDFAETLLPEEARRVCSVP